MTVQIRPFAATDYDALAALNNAAYSDATGTPMIPHSADDIRESDAERPAHVHFLRLVAEQDGAIIGAAEYDQEASRFEPGKFWFDVFVHPAQQRHGLGTLLYDRSMESLLALDPLVLRAHVREDLTHGVEFLQNRGWHEAARLWESYLEVANADLSALVGAAETLAASGITIKTLDELAGDPQRDEKLYDLAWLIRQDMPDLDAPTRPSFEEFQRRRLQHKDLILGAYFVAVHGDTYVGLLNHWRFADNPGILKVGALGVVREYRGRDIAKALKLREIEFARANGYHSLRTVNESGNRAVLSINERLGFVKRPAWLDMVKEFAQG